MNISDPNLFVQIPQQIRTYAHLPAIHTPDGGRMIVDDADLWLAAKINATVKKVFPSDVYWEKKKLAKEQQQKFIEGVRNNSWNRLHMGSLVVGGVDVEMQVASLVSNSIALGKFYRIQQQTRRTVILDEVYKNPALADNDEVQASYAERFAWYRQVCDARSRKIRGFDPYVQDAFKLLPLSTMTRITGNWDLRTVKGYSRWRELEYLPSSMRNFGQRLHDSVSREYPTFYQSNFVSTQNSDLTQQLIDKVGSKDLAAEPTLWYGDHSFLLEKNTYFENFYNDMKLDKLLNTESPDSMLVGYFNPLGFSLDEVLTYFKSKDPERQKMLEMTTFAFASRIDISGGIDTWRHTRNNRMVQPIYHALDHNPVVSMPELYRRQIASGSEQPAEFMELSKDAVQLYHSLIKQGVFAKEAIDVLPHSLMLYQIEFMDLFSFLNVMALRTCTHARPEVQKWAKALLRNAGQTPDFKGIDTVLADNLLAHALQRGYCPELGNCKKCGKDILYIPDPFRK